MQMQKSSTFYSSSGQRIQLGRKLGTGGEGDVFECTGDPQVVAKIYHSPPNPEHARKLQAMASICNSNLERIAAWPAQILTSNTSGPVHGFVMRKLGPEFREIVSLYNPSDRKKFFPKADYSFLAHTAVNLAAAFETMHAAGIVIGDVNQKNIMVNHDALIRLVDCDSFQIKHRNELFRCRVGAEDYTPPELQGIHFDKIDRNANHDNFGLAVILFTLLMMGRHPFSGVALRSNPIDLREAIRGFHFAYGAPGSGSILAPPPTAPPVDILSPGLLRMFENAFSKQAAHNGGRPLSHEWMGELAHFREHLLVCPKNHMHRFGNGRSSCPWCEFDKKSIVFFISALQSAPVQKFAINKDVYAQFQALYNRYIALNSSIGQAAVPNSKIAAAPLDDATVAAKYALYSTRLCAGWLVVALMLRMMRLESCAIVVVILLVWWGIEETTQNKFKREREQRRKTLELAESDYFLLQKKQARLSSNLSMLKPIIDSTRQIAHEASSLPAALEKETKDLEVLKRKFQENDYLSQFSVDSASIPNFGPNRKATLRSFGIHTAAEIDGQSVRSIHGMGESLVQNLLDWREDLLRNFRFNAKKPIPLSIIHELNKQYSVRSAELELEMKEKIKKLEQTICPVESEWSSFSQQFQKAVQDYQQATADMEVVKG